MPEVWLNYGAVDVVLDVRAENLGLVMEGSAGALSDDTMTEQLSDVDLSGSPTLVVLQDTAGVRQVISRLYGMCEAKSLPFPRILADEKARASIKQGLPEGSVVGMFDSPGDDGLDNDLVFIAEVEADGLFGYRTVCTRLLRLFGGDNMLAAYGRRDGDLPVPGVETAPYQVARKFADQFEVLSIDVAGGRRGASQIQVGHPSMCDAGRLAESYRTHGAHSVQAVIGSTGSASNNTTLADSLPSLWNVCGALKTGGQAVLLAECGGGLGSDALVWYAEGRMSQDDLRGSHEYVAGMEDVLFLEMMRKEADIVLVSALPDLYMRRLDIRSARRSQDALDGILQKSPRRKVAIMPDAARTILRHDPSGEGGAHHG